MQIYTNSISNKKLFLLAFALLAVLLFGLSSFAKQASHRFADADVDLANEEDGQNNNVDNGAVGNEELAVVDQADGQNCNNDDKDFDGEEADDADGVVDCTRVFLG